MRNTATYTVEDILAKEHSGQWFGWSDATEKVYKNLVIHDKSIPKPSQKYLEDKLAALIAAEPIRLLRIDRDKLLASSDWAGLSDTALTSEVSAKWKLYRQKLRDFPSGLDTVEKVKAVTWPEKPE